MDLRSAIDAHAAWKVKLRRALITCEKLDADTLSMDNQCAFGKWLHGEARQKFGQSKSYADCLRSHAAFHRIAGSIACDINAGETEKAERELDGQAYADITKDIGIAIVRLRKETGLS